MARKATVDAEMVARMLRDGQSTQVVAEHFGVSRQAIDLHRRKFIKSGQLEDRRAPRVAAASSGYDASKPARIESAPSVPLDRLIELVIEAFDSLKKVPGLEAELEKYRRDYQKAAERIGQLEKEISRRLEQEARWKQAVPPDIARPGK